MGDLYQLLLRFLFIRCLEAMPYAVISNAVKDIVLYPPRLLPPVYPWLLGIHHRTSLSIGDSSKGVPENHLPVLEDVDMGVLFSVPDRPAADTNCAKVCQRSNYEKSDSCRNSPSLKNLLLVAGTGFEPATSGL